MTERKPRGARVARGPMAADHFTTLHNLIFRNGVINTRYVGVFGYIVSHQDEWVLDEQRIAKDLGVGIDFIRAALKNFEAAHCLIRTRERTPRGTLGDAVWFVTDLPMQMRQMGVTDDALIRQQVVDAYTQWCSRWTTNIPVIAGRDQQGENPTLALACGDAAPDTPPDASGAASEPPADKPAGQDQGGEKPTLAEPTLAEPTLVFPATKKEELVVEEPPTNQPSPPDGDVGSPAVVGEITGGRAGGRDLPDTPGAALLARLPGKWRPGRRASLRLVGRVDALLAAGCDPDELIARWTSRDAANPVGALTYRIQDTDVPTAASAPARGIRVLPACDVCGTPEGGLAGERMVDVDGGGARRCECHPQYRQPATAGSVVGGVVDGVPA